jgi:glycerol-3-phosphate cytidylyltransferase
MNTKNSIVYTLGVWDGMHIGHLKLLERASKLGHILIVGVVEDNAVKAVKGEDRPKHKENERLEIIRAIKYVDDAILVPNFDPNFFVRKYSSHNYHIHYSNNFSDNLVYVRGEDQNHLKKLVEPNFTVVYMDRTPGVSTTDLHFGGK